MTTDQAQLLHDRLSDIWAQLKNFPIPEWTRDDHAANQTIADLRTKLSHIDQRLFECYRLLDRFYDTNRPHVVRKHTAPTIDDLEI